MAEIIECEEFASIDVGPDQFLIDGEIRVDPRITGRGYLNVSIAQGRLRFRADRYVGLIPINDRLSLRVRPRSPVANIGRMLVLSGVAPTAIVDFARGYLPKFETGAEAERIYAQSLIAGVETIISRGLIKSYTPVSRPPAWRGRLLVSDTIKRHRARNVRYRAEFDYQVLSHDGPENLALKRVVRQVRQWLVKNDPRSPLILRTDRVLARLSLVRDQEASTGQILREISRSLVRLPAAFSYYREPLWIAYLILQRQIPDLTAEGFVSLDSMMVDLSAVFEAYTRRVLQSRADQRGWRVINGNSKPHPFFMDSRAFQVKPDILVMIGNEPVAVVDAKYKPSPKESDRYELLAFMDAIGATVGAFVCPSHDENVSHFLGTTAGGKELSLLRFDLAVADLDAEAERFIANIEKLIARNRNYG